MVFIFTCSERTMPDIQTKQLHIMQQELKTVLRITLYVNYRV